MWELVVQQGNTDTHSINAWYTIYLDLVVVFFIVN